MIMRDCKMSLPHPITRRDFLDGVSIAIGGAILARPLTGSEPDSAYYPPALTGMRGDHDSSYTYAHSLRDQQFWKSESAPEATGESYDLVVAGGGISGLAAAYFFRQRVGASARILILDNHDDFGGHAKRNEFQVGKRTLVSYGGTQSIERPAQYSNVAKRLLQELHIDVREFYHAFNRKLYQRTKLGTGAFFEAKVSGEDRLLTGMGELPWDEFFSKAPVSDTGRRDLIRLYTEKKDYLSGSSRQEKIATLKKISYADYLTKYVNVGAETVAFLQTGTHDNWGVGIDAVSAFAAFDEGEGDYGLHVFPGFDGLGLDGEGEDEHEEPYIFHFPDGNASVARMLVRALIPGAIPGHTMKDIVTARAGYSRLDQPSSSVRLRLNSTVVRARNSGAPESAKTVEVAYMHDGRLLSVEAKACVLACFNGMIPYICPEMSEPQKKALAFGVKTPLVYTHVAIRDWKAFHKLGVHQVTCPASYFNYVALDFPVSLGHYKFPAKPEEPMVLFLLRTPCSPGKPRREQHRIGRAELLSTPFGTFEENVRDQLQRMLGAGGFDAARDIEAITVNRWAHGYAYEYNSLEEPDWPESERPNVIGRQRFGRISIANSDAAARAYSDAAIDQADRAVNEILEPT
jgi:spermidine dehydrogenase